MIFKSFKPFLSGCLTLTLLHNQEKGRFILSTAVYTKKSIPCKEDMLYSTLLDCIFVKRKNLFIFDFKKQEENINSNDWFS